uniref:Cell division cycle associated 3 n=1 Tax=Pipistrellus kuhlii TaxID=59472 RepID=A0A7J7ULU7_PIPKU|nr:cell division cycle associated 3 [Pipistrellus kuhlii]
MGLAKNVPVTLVLPPLHNKLLARVVDPSSPSAGIMRTPIQVESSPQPNLAPLASGEQLEDPNQAQDSDPCSPTLGIARAPMKTSSRELTTLLVKELSEEFEAEAPKSNLPPESVLEVPSSSDMDLPLGPQCSLEDQIPHGSQTELPSKQLFSEKETGQHMRDPETLRSSSSKRNRRKPRARH